MRRKKVAVLGVGLALLLLLLNSRDALGGNQAVSPPPSVFEWLQPFRPIITVSKFPPIVEFIAQRIQTQFASYIYEDLSRPPTYDRSTRKPHVASTPHAQNGVDDDLAIATVAPPIVVMVDEYVITSNAKLNQSVQIEYQLKDVVRLMDRAGTAQEAPEIGLEQDVRLIMRQNDLGENVTHVFEQTESPIGNNDVQHDAVVHNPRITYKDVSGLFAEEFAESVLRTHQRADEQNKSGKMIALTKIGKRVYVNAITLKRQ